MKSRVLGVGITALVFSTLMVGCAKKDVSIVGKWSGTLAGRGRPANAIFDFKPDGTDTITITKAGKTVILNENYTVKDDTLMENGTSRTANGKTSVEPAKPKTCTFKVDGDTLSLMPPGFTQPITLTRVKP